MRDDAGRQSGDLARPSSLDDVERTRGGAAYRRRSCLRSYLGPLTRPVGEEMAVTCLTEVYRQPDLRPSEAGGGMAGVLTSGPSAQAASAPAGGCRPM